MMSGIKGADVGSEMSWETVVAHTLKAPARGFIVSKLSEETL